MALIDLVKFSGDPGALAWKFPSDELSTATQVIVNESQEALLFKGGSALDVLGPGTHTLTTGNIPVLNKLVKMPFGDKTPFSAEVWFVNKTVRRDLRWGTTTPIPIFDSKLDMPVNLRAYGSWGMRVAEARSFITQLVGTDIRVDTGIMDDYFLSEIQQHIAFSLGDFFKSVSVLHASAHLPVIAEMVSERLRDSLGRYGVELINFNIASLSLPPEEMKQIQGIMGTGLDETVRIGRLRNATGMTGEKMYGTMRTFDTLETAAANESGTAAPLIAGGMGLGVGMGMGNALSRNMETGLESPQSPVERLKHLKDLLEAGFIDKGEFEEKRKEIISGL